MERKTAQFGTVAAACNCPKDWGTTTRCHKCGQFHLRPGYCQALNPAASEAIASGRRISLEEAKRLAQGPDVTPEPVTMADVTTSEPVTAPDVTTSVTPPVNPDDDRKRKNRERIAEWREKQRLKAGAA
jgi:hypothetical protein